MPEVWSCARVVYLIERPAKTEGIPRGTRSLRCHRKVYATSKFAPVDRK